VSSLRRLIHVCDHVHLESMTWYHFRKGECHRAICLWRVGSEESAVGSCQLFASAGAAGAVEGSAAFLGLGTAFTNSHSALRSQRLKAEISNK
jgi:hypothetical protein